jgi:ABC-2 type transport system permease protein
MRNFLLVATHEYLKLVRKRSFLFATLGIPLLIVVVMSVTIFLTVLEQDDRPLGYVDQSGILSKFWTPASEKSVAALQPFTDETGARQALEQAEIQGYYVLPSDYLQSHQIKLYYWKELPDAAVREEFDRFVRAHLTAGLPPAVQQRLVDDPLITVRILDSSRKIDSSNPSNLILSFAATFLFFFTAMTSAGYLLQVIADEKENRTIEILITSLNPEELIGGKAVGAMAVSLTQLAIWLLAIAAGLPIGTQFVEPLRLIQIPWMFMLVAMLYFLPAYGLIAALMTAIGGAVTDTRQGQQIAALLNMLFILPVFLSTLVFADPDNPIVIFFTLFPTTSFVTVMMRWSTSVIPIWQLAVGWIVLVVSAVLAMWASARIFRAGMLRYGQSLNLRGALMAVRARHV